MQDHTPVRFTAMVTGPVLGRALEGGGRCPFDPGVVEREVEAAEGLDGAGDEPFDVSVDGHIGVHEQCTAATVGDLGRDLLAAARVDVGDDHRRAFACERDHRCPTDPRAPAGHDRHLAVE